VVEITSYFAVIGERRATKSIVSIHLHGARANHPLESRDICREVSVAHILRGPRKEGKMECEICQDLIYDEEDKIELGLHGGWVHAQCLIEEEPNT